MIIDFCGLPGCGKTTLSNRILAQMKSEVDVRIFNRKDLLIYGKLKSIFSGRRDVCTNHLGISRDEFVDLARLCALHDYDNEEKYINRLVSLMEYLCYQWDRNIVFEEGPVQYITSLAYRTVMEHNGNMDRLLDVVFSNFSDYYIVNCEISVSAVQARIEGREGKRDRYKVDDASLQAQLLQVKQDNINFVVSSPCVQKHNIITINMEHSLEENTSRVLDFIRNR